MVQLMSNLEPPPAEQPRSLWFTLGPAHGWTAGELPLGSAPATLICGKWATVRGKKPSEGALPACWLEPEAHVSV